MIPENVFTVVTTGVGHIGCVSSNLKPFHADTLGIACDRQNGEVTCFLNKGSSVKFVENTDYKSRVSLFVGIISHEAYNLKGDVKELRPVSENDISLCAQFKKVLYKLYDEMGIPESLADKYWNKLPDLAVVFQVEKIFIQTPGPDAGKQIFTKERD